MSILAAFAPISADLTYQQIVARSHGIGFGLLTMIIGAIFCYQATALDELDREDPEFFDWWDVFFVVVVSCGATLTATIALNLIESIFQILYLLAVQPGWDIVKLYFGCAAETYINALKYSVIQGLGIAVGGCIYNTIEIYRIKREKTR